MCLLERPLESRSKIIEIAFEPLYPVRFRSRIPFHVRTVGNAGKGLDVPPKDRGGLSDFVEPFARIFSQRLEQAVPPARLAGIDHEQRLVGQRGQVVENAPLIAGFPDAGCALE